MTSTIILALAVFGASSVEMVEAFTIVLAAGISRGWRSAIEGTLAAVVTLAVIVLAVGVPLIHLVPLDALRVIVGGMLLVLGLNWLRKAILRSSGHKALHDEDAIYAKTVSELARSEPVGAEIASTGPTGTEHAGTEQAGTEQAGGSRHTQRDATGFVVAFKGVFLEGLEVVMIVLTLGSSSRHLGLAAVSAGAAFVVVAGIGALVARQLSEVPENALKMGVGIMLSSFGVFWVGEGTGLHWPGSDVFLLALVAMFAVTAAVLVQAMRRALPAEHVATPLSEAARA